MSRTTVNVLLGGGLNRERVEYLCELEEIPYRHIRALSEGRSLHSGQDILIVCAPSTSSEFREVTSKWGQKHRFLLLADGANSVLAKEEDVDSFFNSGGFAVFQEGWSDFAFRRLLQEMEKTNGYLNDLELECSRRVLFYPGGAAVPAVTRFIGGKSSLAELYGELPTVRGGLEFALDLAPGFVAHGRCKVLSNSTDPRTGRTLVRVEFVEFDSVSRLLLSRFVSDGLSLQNSQRGTSRRTNEEYLAFLLDMLNLLGAEKEIRFNMALAPFDQGYAISNHPRLICFCFQLFERMMGRADFLASGMKVTFRLKENREKRLVLMMEFPMENSVEFLLTGELILEAKSAVGAFVTSDDLILMNSQDMALEQYPDEPCEHLAICLEGR